MITIEDLLEELENILIASIWQGTKTIKSPADRKFMQDLCSRTRGGGVFSTKQAYIAIKIISKHAVLFGDEDLKFNYIRTFNLSTSQVLAICENPVYRNAPYQSTVIPREVRYLGNSKLGFKCKYSPQIIDRIKSLKELDLERGRRLDWPKFNKKYKIWIVEVTENNIENVMKIIKEYKFEFDEPVVQFLTDCENSKNSISTAVVDDESIQVVVQNNNLLQNWLSDIILMEEHTNV